MKKKVVIVGGVAGGASTAARLRRLDEEANIVMFEKGEYISFANCGLPYYIGDVIKERAQLIVQTVDEMSHKFNMDIRVLSEVIHVNRSSKTVTVKNLQTGETYEEAYDVLVLSPGAKPSLPPIPGIDQCDNLFTLRNIPDTDQIKKYITTHKPKEAVVIGGGFIGVEMMENMQELGVDVTLIEANEQVMAPLDYEMASILHEHILENNVKLILGDSVKSFDAHGKKVILQSGKIIDTDLIILAIGVTPETTIAKEAGLELTERGAIVVDEQMKTSDKAIYALGDAVAIKDYVSQQQVMIPLAWPANRQGRIVADNICGKNSTYKGTLGSSVAKIFDYTAASTGNNERTLKRLGMNYKSIHIHPGSHAGYYPGAFPIAFKLLFDPQTGRILGAQGVGMDGVEKRIDMLATAIKGNLTIYDLQDIEPCYAPPYNSAKDPVNMLGYYAENIMEGLVQNISWEEVDKLNPEKDIIVDVREEFELATGMLPNSLHIPLGQLRTRMNELPRDKKIYVTCQVGQRGYVASRILTGLGIDCKNIDGGIKTYFYVKRAEKALQEQDKVCPYSCQEEEKPVMALEDLDITEINAKVKLNACGLQCPGPIRRVFEEISQMQDGEVLEVSASDPGFKKDIAAWCDRTQNTLIRTEFDKTNKAFIAYIQKGSKRAPLQNSVSEEKNGATLVVFSGELDKAIASFIIATGAASMGKEVTMFFTFWGLNILKRKDHPKVSKDTMEKMFDMMLPGHTGQLGLSKMNMGGMGPAMIKQIMKKHNVDDIDTLIKNAIDMGVKVVACSMSMELMGIKYEEFIDGVEIAGVAAYLGAADQSNLNLFI
ncbi:MAG: CoA-disulfide reductase [Cellulosilyticaceae bacterium]